MAIETDPIVYITASYDPRREREGRPYRLDTVDGKRPRERYFDTYQALCDAVKRRNPGSTVREA